MGEKLNTKTLKRDLVLFFFVSGLIGFATGMTDSVFNNFYASYNMTPLLRGWLEMPRELPGLLLVVISGVLIFMGNVRMAVLANLLTAVGLIGLGYLSPSYGLMAFSLFIYSSGIHLYMPLTSSIGMSLAEEGKTGRRLGQFSSVSIGAGILGSMLIYFGFKHFNLDFRISFTIALVFIGIAAFLLFKMNPGKPDGQKFRFVFDKRYSLFYILYIIYGARKQIFATFAPWLLIRIYDQPTEVFAVLGIVGSIVGVFGMPLFGRAIDHFGERKVIMTESILFAIVCIGYAFIGDLGRQTWGLYLVFACFIADRLLMTAGMTRNTYLKKIIIREEDLTPSLSMGISIDHIISMTIPVFAGWAWQYFGYQYVFIAGIVIAVLYFIAGNFITYSSTKPTVDMPSNVG